MTNDRLIGVGLGAALCAVVITGNVVRAEPHLVSIYPDVVSGMVAPLAVYLAGRRRRLRGAPSAAVQAFAARIGASAGAVFAVGLTVFTAYWLPATPLWAVGSVAAFVSVFVLSCIAGYAAGQTRVIAV
jgi:hypothetical protein